MRGTDYDDDDDDDDDEPPPPPPEGFEGIFDPVFDNEDAPPPPPEGLAGVYRDSSAVSFPPQRPTEDRARAGTFNLSLDGKKGSARGWSEQQLAQQRRATNMERGSAAPAGVADDSSDDEDNDEDDDTLHSRSMRRHQHDVDSDDDSAHARQAENAGEALRMQAQRAALVRGGTVPKMADSTSGQFAALRSPNPTAAESAKAAADPTPKLGRWGAGGDGAVEGSGKKKGWGALRMATRLTGGVKSGAGATEEPAMAPAAAEAPDTASVARTEEELLAEIEAEEEASGVPPISRVGALHGWLFKRGGLKSKAWKKRYAVYEPKTKAFTYYADERSAANDAHRKGRVTVTQSSPVNKADARSRVERRLSKATLVAEGLAAAGASASALTPAAMAAAAKDSKYEFKFSTTENRVFECYTESAQAYRTWLETMPHWGSELTMGWLYKRKHGSKKTTFDRRYAIFDPSNNLFSYYAGEHDARMDRDRKGAVTITTTILYAERFAFYTSTDRFYECFAETNEELHMWMDALPSPAGAKVEGWVYKHKRGASSRKFAKRYAIYEMETGMFSYFTDATRAVPRGRATVLYAVPNHSGRSHNSVSIGGRAEGPPSHAGERPGGGGEISISSITSPEPGGTLSLAEMRDRGMLEFSIRTEDNKFFDVTVESAYTGGQPKNRPADAAPPEEMMLSGVEARDAWIAALPQPPSYAMMGWVTERRHLANDGIGGMMSRKVRRYAVFDMAESLFCCYLSQESALLDDKQPEFRAVVKYALPRPQKEPDVWEFAFNTQEEHAEGRGRFHEFCVDDEAQQLGWIDALPPPREYTVKGYLHKRRIGALKLSKDDFDLRYAVYDVISGFFAYYETEQEALLDMKPRGAARVVSAVMRPTKDHPFMFSFFSDDGKDFQLYVDSDEQLQMWMSALPINAGGNADRIMTTLRGELDSLKRQLKTEGISGDVLKASTITPEQALGNTSGPVLNRAARGSNVDALRLKRELDHLRAENRRLRMEGAGDLEEDDEKELLQGYQSALASILVMRRQGKFIEEIFDTYNEMLAQLSDGLVTEMYKNFMLIYLEEVRTRLQRVPSCMHVHVLIFTYVEARTSSLRNGRQLRLPMLPSRVRCAHITRLPTFARRTRRRWNV